MLLCCTREVVPGNVFLCRCVFVKSCLWLFQLHTHASPTVCPLFLALLVYTGSSLPSLIDMLVKLYALHQPLVSRHTSEVLAAVAGNSSSHLGSGQLAQLLGLLIDGEAAQLLAGELFVITCVWRHEHVATARP